MADPSFSSADLAAVLGPPPRRPWMTWLITGSILAVYLAQLAGARGGVDTVGNALSVGPLAFAQHRDWSLLTYAWAHAVPIPAMPPYAGFHLAINVVPLFCIAPALERRRGPWWLLTLFCTGAIASALAWLASGPRPNEEMIGASGALFALITAGGVLGVQIWRADFVFFQLPLRLDLRLAAVVLCAVEALQMLAGGMAEVAHVAHLGGALYGVTFAVLTRARTPR